MPNKSVGGGMTRIVFEDSGVSGQATEQYFSINRNQVFLPAFCGLSFSEDVL